MIQVYRCADEHETEILTKYSERPKTVQCDCGKRAKLAIGLPSVKFVGDGWQTPQPYNPRPFEGSALEGAEEASQAYVAKRREKGYDPTPQEKKITVDLGE